MFWEPRGHPWHHFCWASRAEDQEPVSLEVLGSGSSQKMKHLPAQSSIPRAMRASRRQNGTGFGHRWRESCLSWRQSKRLVVRPRLEARPEPSSTASAACADAEHVFSSQELEAELAVQIALLGELHVGR